MKVPREREQDVEADTTTQTRNDSQNKNRMNRKRSRRHLDEDEADDNDDGERTSNMKRTTDSFQEVWFSRKMWTQGIMHRSILECVIGDRDQILNEIKEHGSFRAI